MTTKSISLYPILIVNFIGSLGFSLVLPFLVFLVIRFGGNAELYGLLGATYPALQLLGAPVLGRWSDIYGRRKVLLLSQAGTLLSWVIFLIALYLPMQNLLEVNSGQLGTFMLTLPLLTLFLARALDGLTGGNISVANAYLADITEEKDRNKNFGKMAVSSNLGFILGPALAGILGATALQETLPIIAAIVISAAATFIIAFRLPESNPCSLSENPERGAVHKVFGQETRDCLEFGQKVHLRDIFQLKYVPYLLMLYFFIFLGFTIFYTAFPIHVTQTLGWNIFELGIFFSALGLLMATVQGPVLARLSRRFSEAKLILSGNLVLATNFVLMSSENIAVLYVAALFFAVGNGLMWPSVLSLLSRLAGAKYQGSVQGFAGSFGSLASILGLVGGGFMYDALGSTTFLVSAGIIYLIFLLSFRLITFERALSNKVSAA